MNPRRTSGFSKGNNEFIIGKRKGLQVWSLPGGMEELCAGRKEEDFCLRHFYTILNWRWEEIGATPISSRLQWPSSHKEDLHIHLS
jgi:hypothetical protein